MAAWAAVAFVTILLVGPVTRFVSTSAEWLDYPYPRAGSEGLILYESLLVKHGGDLYAPITPEHFISGPYPPLYYWLAAAVLPNNLPDFSAPGNSQSTFLPGRIISLVAALIASVVIPLVVLFEGGYTRRIKQRQKAWFALAGGAVGGALLLTLPQVTVWATRFRGDMLMVALTACGLACIAFGAGGRGQAVSVATQKAEEGMPGTLLDIRRYSVPALLAGAIFFALALFTKQTALAGPVASAIFLLGCDWRVGLKWCAFMAVAVLLPFAALDIASGHWFYLKMVDYHSLPLRESTLARLLQFAFFEDQWPLVLLTAGYLVFWLVEWWHNKGRNAGSKMPRLIPIFVLVALVMLPTGAVVGADHNHLLVPGLAVCLAVGAIAAKLLTIADSEHDESGTTRHGTKKWRDGLFVGVSAFQSSFYHRLLAHQIPQPLQKHTPFTSPT